MAIKQSSRRAKKERGARQHQVRAHADKWELIKRFPMMVKYMVKLDERRRAVEILERTP